MYTTFLQISVNIFIEQKIFPEIYLLDAVYDCARFLSLSTIELPRS